MCGSQALACYDPRQREIFASPEDQLDAPPAKEIVTHEYGHHLANNSNDAPWQALDYGTKRWSSYENICAKAADGTASPGDEGSHYFQNSGEAFAESYRVLNLQKQGQTNIGWDIVDPSFYPDATALTLLAGRHHHAVGRPDARRTCTARSAPASCARSRCRHSSTARSPRICTSPTKAKMRLALYNGSDARDARPTIRYEICGQRTLTLKVERLSGRGAFTVAVTKP